MAEKLNFILEVDDKGTIKVKKFKGAVDDADSSVNKSSKSFNGFSKAAKGAGTVLSSLAAQLGIVAGIAGFAGMTASVIKTGAVFEQTMKTVKGVARATDDEYQRLIASARLMGEQTEWTASQAGQALQFLAMAGFDVEKSIAALPGTLDLGRAADITSDVLTAFQLDVKELNRVNDVFIGTITRSNTNVEMMAESMKYAAPLAKAYGYSIEETSALIGILAQAGIKGSMAGTQLAFAFQKTEDAAKELGIESNNLIDVLEAATKAGWGANKMMEIFDMRGGRAGLVLKDLVPNIRDFVTELQNSTGESKALADEMRSGLLANWNEFKAVIESVSLDTFSRFESGLKSTLKSATQAVRDHRDEWSALLDAVGKVYSQYQEGKEIVRKAMYPKGSEEAAVFQFEMSIKEIDRLEEKLKDLEQLSTFQKIMRWGINWETGLSNSIENVKSKIEELKNELGFLEERPKYNLSNVGGRNIGLLRSIQEEIDRIQNRVPETLVKIPFDKSFVTPIPTITGPNEARAKRIAQEQAEYENEVNQRKLDMWDQAYEEFYQKRAKKAEEYAEEGAKLEADVWTKQIEERKTLDDRYYIYKSQEIEELLRKEKEEEDKALAKAKQMQEEEAKFIEDRNKQMWDNIQNVNADIFREMMDHNINSFDDALSVMSDSFKNFAAEIAAEQITVQLKAVMGGDLFGNIEGLGGAVTSAGLGYAGASILGGDKYQSALAGLGSGVGFFAGGPIGAVIGGAAGYGLGSLFGGKKDKTPRYKFKDSFSLAGAYSAETGFTGGSNAFIGSSGPKEITVAVQEMYEGIIAQANAALNSIPLEYKAKVDKALAGGFTLGPADKNFSADDAERNLKELGDLWGTTLEDYFTDAVVKLGYSSLEEFNNFTTKFEQQAQISAGIITNSLFTTIKSDYSFENFKQTLNQGIFDSTTTALNDALMQTEIYRAFARPFQETLTSAIEDSFKGGFFNIDLFSGRTNELIDSLKSLKNQQSNLESATNIVADVMQQMKDILGLNIEVTKENTTATTVNSQKVAISSLPTIGSLAGVRI